MRADRLLLVLLPLAVACGPARVLTRPEGNGGWSETRRRDELERRATAAAVPLDPEAPPPGPDDADAPLSLGQVLALATSGNRRIAEAERGVDAAAARVRDTRGRLLPETIQTGRYNAYTDPLRNTVSLPTITGGNGETFGGPSSFVIRQQRFGRLNTTSTLPLDVTGQIWKTLTAAQAGYRGERARAWATTSMQKVAVIRRLLRPARGAAPARGRRSRTSPSTASSWQTRRAATTPAGSPRTSCWSCRCRCRNGEQELRRRDLDIDQARRRLNETVGRPIDAPTARRRRRRPSRPAAGRRGAARRLREQPGARLPARGAAASRGHRRGARAQPPARLEGGGAIDYATSGRSCSRSTIGSGFVGFTWDLGTDDRREAQHRRGPHRRPSATASRSSGSCARSKRAVRDTQRRRRRAARRARHRARRRRAGRGEPAHPPASSSTPAAPPARTCSTPRRC